MDRPFVFFEVPETRRGAYTRQQLKNEYFFMMLEQINTHMVEFNKTYEWKTQQIKYLTSLVGYPVKLTRWQKFLAFLTL